MQVAFSPELLLLLSVIFLQAKFACSEKVGGSVVMKMSLPLSMICYIYYQEMTFVFITILLYY